jgi:hypothetical protein
MSVSNIIPSKWLSVTQIIDDSEAMSSKVEMLWIEVLIPNFKLLVCVVYRPPGTTESFWDNFDYSLEQALNFTENIIITGERSTCLYCQTLRIYVFLIEYGILILIIVAL